MLLFCLTGISSACGNHEKDFQSSYETISMAEEERDATASLWGNPEILFYRKIAYYSDADNSGWVYRFVYEDKKDPESYPDWKPSHYSFNGYNLRYRFDPARVSTKIREVGDKKYREYIISGCQRFGIANEAEERDLKVLYSFLSNDKTPDEILNTNPDDYTFEVLDKEMVFSLIREALTSEPREPQKESLDYPGFSFLQEPYYLDGYKFQIAYVRGMGYTGEIYIDVLYQSEDAYGGYIQLSDIVDQMTASPEQREAFKLIQTVRENIRGEEYFLVKNEEYKGKKIAGIDFDRLYTFLNDIEMHHEDIYSLSDESLGIEPIE